MRELIDYLSGLTPQDQSAFAARCQTSIGYLRKAVSVKQKLGVELCIRLDRESGGAIRCERLRPGLDWEHLRAVALRASADAKEKAPANKSQAAIEKIANEAANA